jgi:hypothetical protein
MRFKEFFKMFTEAPINNLELKGDWSTPSRQGWDKPSQGILKSNKGLERMRRLWSKTDDTFDIYLLKNKKVHNYVELGRVDVAFVRDKLGLDIDFNDDHITIIYTNNKGAELMAATPWTLAHRFGHALARENGLKKDWTAYSEFEKQVQNTVEEIAKFVYNINIKDMERNQRSGYGDNARYFKNTQRLEKIKKYIAYSLGTFKSARDKNLRNAFEFTNELIAQYIVTGKITLNKTLPDKVPMTYAWGNVIDQLRKSITPDQQEELDEMIKYAEETLNVYCQDLISSAIGNIYVM